MSTIGGINVNTSPFLQGIFPQRSGLISSIGSNSTPLGSLQQAQKSYFVADYSVNTVLSSRSSALRDSVLAARPLTVAKGDLSEIKSLLESQHNITTLLAGNTLSKQEIASVTQQFQDNLKQIDTIATQKNFKVETSNPEIKLLSSITASKNSVGITAPKSGSIATSPAITVNGTVGDDQTLANTPVAVVNGTATQKVAGQAILTLSNNNLASGDQININGVTLVANGAGDNGFTVGDTIASTVRNITNKLNNSTDTNIQQANYAQNSDTSILVSLKGDGINNDFTIGYDIANGTTKANITVADANGNQTVDSSQLLTGVTQTIATVGTAGVDSSTTLATNGSVSLRLTNNNIDKGDSFTFNGVEFTADTRGRGDTNFKIQDTVEQTIDSLIDKLNSSTDARVQEATFSRSGADTIVATLKNAGAATADNDFGIGFNIAQNTKAQISVLNADGTETVAANNSLESQGSTIEAIGTAGVADIVGTQGAVNLNFSGQLKTGQTVTINGATFTASNNNNGDNFKIGKNLRSTINNLVNKLNFSSNEGVAEASYSRSGSSLVIQLNDEGINNDFSFGFNLDTNKAKNTISVSDASGKRTLANTHALSGGSIESLGTAGNTEVIGSKGVAQLQFDSNKITDGVTLNFNGKNFTAGGNGNNGFAIGENIEQTLDNLVATLNASTNNNVEKATYSRVGTDTLKIETKVNGASNDYTIGFDFVQETKAEVEVSNSNGVTQAVSGAASGTIASLGGAGADAVTIDATKGTAQLKFDNNQIETGAEITLNGTTLVAGVKADNGFAIGATLSDTLDNLVNKLNSSTDANLQKATYARTDDNTISVTLKNAGTADNDFTIGFDFTKASAKTKLSVSDSKGVTTADNSFSLTGGTIGELGTKAIAETKLSDGATRFIPNLEGNITNLAAKFNAGGVSDAAISFNNNTVTFSAIINGHTYTSKPVALQGGNYAGEGTGDNGFGNKIDANTVLTFVRDGGSASDPAVTLTTGNQDIYINNRNDADSVASNFQTLLTDNNVSIKQDRNLAVNNPFNTALGGIIAQDVSLRSDSVSANVLSIESFVFNSKTSSLSTVIDGIKFTADLSSSSGFTGTYDAASRNLSTNGTIIFSNNTDSKQLRINLDNVAKDNISLAVPENAGALIDGLNELFGTQVQVTTKQVDAKTALPVGVSGNTIGSVVNEASTANLFVDNSGQQINFATTADVVGSTIIIESALNKVSSLIDDVDKAISRNEVLVGNNLESLVQLETKRASLLEDSAVLQQKQALQLLVQQHSEDALATQGNNLEKDLVQLIFKLNIHS